VKENSGTNENESDDHSEQEEGVSIVTLWSETLLYCGRSSNGYEPLISLGQLSADCATLDATQSVREKMEPKKRNAPAKHGYALFHRIPYRFRNFEHRIP